MLFTNLLCLSIWFFSVVNRKHWWALWLHSLVPIKFLMKQKSRPTVSCDRILISAVPSYVSNLARFTPPNINIDSWQSEETKQGMECAKQFPFLSCHYIFLLFLGSVDRLAMKPILNFWVHSNLLSEWMSQGDSKAKEAKCVLAPLSTLL